MAAPTVQQVARIVLTAPQRFHEDAFAALHELARLQSVLAACHSFQRALAISPAARTLARRRHDVLPPPRVRGFTQEPGVAERGHEDDRDGELRP
jgi:hypothetical protein